MYRVGFRALEEVAEASVEELAGIQGIDEAETAEKIRDSASSTMERIRDERLNAIATRDEPPTERERLLCVHGLGVRTLTLLEDGGYKTLSSVVKEDADRLGIKTGIGLKKAAAIKKAAQEFAAKETELYAQARARLAASGALGAGAAGEPEPPVETESSAGVRAE